MMSHTSWSLPLIIQTGEDNTSGVWTREMHYVSLHNCNTTTELTFFYDQSNLMKMRWFIDFCSAMTGSERAPEDDVKPPWCLEGRHFCSSMTHHCCGPRKEAAGSGKGRMWTHRLPSLSHLGRGEKKEMQMNQWKKTKKKLSTVSVQYLCFILLSYSIRIHSYHNN